MKDASVMDATGGVLEGEPAIPSDASGAECSPDREGPNARGLLVAMVVTAVGGTTMWFASTLETSAVGESIGPRWWPTVLGGTLVAGAAAIGLVALRRPDPVPEQRVSAHGLGRLGAVVTAIVLYGLGWYFFHFLPVTAGFLAALMFVTGGRGVKALLVFPVSTAALLYGLFGLLLRVPL